MPRGARPCGATFVCAPLGMARASSWLRGHRRAARCPLLGQSAASARSLLPFLRAGAGVAKARGAPTRRGREVAFTRATQSPAQPLRRPDQALGADAAPGGHGRAGGLVLQPSELAPCPCREVQGPRLSRIPLLVLKIRQAAAQHTVAPPSGRPVSGQSPSGTHVAASEATGRIRHQPGSLGSRVAQGPRLANWCSGTHLPGRQPPLPAPRPATVGSSVLSRVCGWCAEHVGPQDEKAKRRGPLR